MKFREGRGKEEKEKKGAVTGYLDWEWGWMAGEKRGRAMGNGRGMEGVRVWVSGG